MKKAPLLALTLAFTSSLTFAAPSTADKQEALKIALNFGNSTHCDGSAFHQSPLSSVFVVGGHDGVYNYAVLQTADYHCSGGNGTFMAMLTPVVQYGARTSVDFERYPSGDLFEYISHPHLNTRFIESANYNPASKQLTIINGVYDDHDSNAHASKRYQVVIDLQNLAVISSRYLGRNNP